jgi:putative transposase
MKFDPRKHQRRSIRLKGYDYAQPGAYFVTLCAWQREDLFGAVVNGEMHLNPLGQIVHDEWLRSMGIRQEIRLYEDEFVVMPNHLHGIVWIVDTVGADGVRPDGTRSNDIPPDGSPEMIGALTMGMRGFFWRATPKSPGAGLLRNCLPCRSAASPPAP